MDKPNVLVIMCDQMKATASHLYGNAFCETPSMARLADSGVLYQHAISPHPLCMPCRVSFWTSQFPHSHGGRRNQTPMPEDATHAFKIWKEQGFKCGLIGKNHCFESESDHDLFDVFCDISHAGISDRPRTKGMDWFRPVESIKAARAVRRNMTHQNVKFAYAASDFPLEDYSTGLIAGQTVRFLEEYADDPFALWVSFPDPHEPWELPRKYYEMFEGKIERSPGRDDEFSDGTAPERNQILYDMLSMETESDEDIDGVIAAYYGMVRFLDDGIGQILDALERLNLRENTIVVFCSDHGDFMGDHGMQCKGGVFYDSLTRVPLIASWPGHIPEGKVDESMVNLIDIVPTLFELQGTDVPRAMHGEGLPTVTDAEPRDAAFSEYGAGGPLYTRDDLEQLEKPWGRKTLIQSLHAREAAGRCKMVRTRDWKYVHDPMGDKDELYDLVNDPHELRNVIDNPDHKAVLADLRLKLADWSINTEDAKPVPLPE